VRKVFTRLNVSSRNQFPGAIGDRVEAEAASWLDVRLAERIDQRAAVNAAPHAPCGGAARLSG
jgi:hypothetical protein